MSGEGAVKSQLILRPEFDRVPVDASSVGEVVRPLSWLQRLMDNALFRRGAILAALALIWQLYALWLHNSLLFPTLTDTIGVMVHDFADGTLLQRTEASLEVLLMGYAAGVALAAVLTTLAVSTRLGDDILSTLTAIFNPLPAIALLPLALIWFGLGTPSLIFVLVHGVLWAIALNTSSGFRSVPETLRMSGRNYGLSGVRYVVTILMPAAFPSILTGLKIGWAFAWRTLIAAELVFGVSSRSGGLGWYIFEAREELNTSSVFAGLLTVIIIGLLVESVLFRAIEARTVEKWGMQR
ncbi:MAG: ABC transporter permease [Hyphomicrobiales bacterium]|nr:ABC transporter permease [Hyphomicrobiales bacterium]MDE2114480.1 ABC transporter permease [Hyphomicrobiales bacterium]